MITDNNYFVLDIWNWTKFLVESQLWHELNYNEFIKLVHPPSHK